MAEEPAPADLGRKNPWALVQGQSPRLWLAVWGLLLACQIIGVLWYPTPDSCAYLSIARSLATTARAAYLGNLHLTYALGYPFLISPIFLIHGSPFLMLSLVHAALAFLYLAGVYVWVKRHVPEAALPIALLAVGHVVVLGLFRRVLSEAVFLPLMIWLLNALALLSHGRTRWGPLLAAVFLLIALALIRQAGIFFAVGFGLQMVIQAWRRQVSWRRACLVTVAVGLPAALALGGMIAFDKWTAAQEQTWSNLDILTRSSIQLPVEHADQAVLQQCLEGVRLRISEVGRLTIPGMFNSYAKYGTWLNVNMLLYVPLFALLVWGWIRFVRRRLDAFALTLPLYVALYIYWPFDQSGRYFAPLLPLFFLCFWCALEKLGQKRRPLLGVLAVAHMVVALGYWLCIDRPRAADDNRHWSDVRCLASLIQAEPGEVQVASDLGGSTPLMLQYILDRPVSQQQPKQPLDATADWLVVAANSSPTAGFIPLAGTGRYQLLHRQSAVVAH